jgi:hypothetical protein
LLRNQIYAGIVDVPEYGARAKRGDFEPLISEDLFYRVQAVLAGRVPSTTPQRPAHPDFHCAPSCDATPAVEASPAAGRSTHLSTKVALCERATRAGFEVALERECAVFVRELHGDDQLPGSMLCGVTASASVVPLDAGRHVACHTCVETFALGHAA